MWQVSFYNAIKRITSIVAEWIEELKTSFTCNYCTSNSLKTMVDGLSEKDKQERIKGAASNPELKKEQDCINSNSATTTGTTNTTGSIQSSANVVYCTALMGTVMTLF